MNRHVSSEHSAEMNHKSTGTPFATVLLMQNVAKLFEIAPKWITRCGSNVMTDIEYSWREAKLSRIWTPLPPSIVEIVVGLTLNNCLSSSPFNHAWIVVAKILLSKIPYSFAKCFVTNANAIMRVAWNVIKTEKIKRTKKQKKTDFIYYSLILFLTQALHCTSHIALINMRRLRVAVIRNDIQSHT